MAIRFDCNLMSTACSLSNISKEHVLESTATRLLHNVNVDDVDMPYDESWSSRFDSFLIGDMFRQIRCISPAIFETFLA